MRLMELGTARRPDRGHGRAETISLSVFAAELLDRLRTR